jgi:hypothetical protein
VRPYLKKEKKKKTHKTGAQVVEHLSSTSVGPEFKPQYCQGTKKKKERERRKQKLQTRRNIAARKLISSMKKNSL